MALFRSMQDRYLGNNIVCFGTTLVISVGLARVHVFKAGQRI